MKPNDLQASDPTAVSRLMALAARAGAASDPGVLPAVSGAGDEGPSAWRDDDLADVFAHQLAAPLVSGLVEDAPPSMPAVNAARLEELTVTADDAAGAAAPPPLATYGDVLRHPAPPVELLQMVKEFGRGGGEGPDAALPPAVGRMLYYAAIAAARLRHGRRITSMNDAALRAGVEWAIRQPWCDAATRDLMRATADRLAADAGAPGPGRGA